MGVQPIISMAQDSVVFYVRNKTMGGNVLAGRDQKPWQGTVDYDAIMHIDSDIIFTPDNFKRLLDHNLPIVSGVYSFKGGKNLATVEHWDEEFFQKHGHFPFLPTSPAPGLIKVAYTGFGWLLVRKGVYEALKYPWFYPEWIDIGSSHDFCSEDVSWCRSVQAAGYDVWVDGSVRVGHEKVTVW